MITGVAHHAATAASGDTTSSVTGQPSRACRVATYAGQPRRLRGSDRNWISPPTASTGSGSSVSRPVNVTTASARYSVGVTSVSASVDNRACRNAGTETRNGPLNNSATNAG